MNNQQWKIKYQDLKLKFLDAIDTSFRLGFEQGAQSAQMQQAQQAEAAAQQAQMVQQPGQPGQDPNTPPGQEQSNGSELDSHINTLEGMLGKTQPGSPEQAGLQKSLNGIKAFQNDLRQKYELKKAEKAIAAIGKAMKTPFTIGKSATRNLSEPAVKALNMQEQIVSDLMKAMADEETKAAETIVKTLDFEQLLKR